MLFSSFLKHMPMYLIFHNHAPDFSIHSGLRQHALEVPVPEVLHTKENRAEASAVAFRSPGQGGRFTRFILRPLPRVRLKEGQ